MRESIKIIQQAVEKIPGGRYQNLEALRFKKANGSMLYPNMEDYEGSTGLSPLAAYL
jgi:NAD(P)H-quinone oxidoreductase subunit H